jgi:hypothetical protein
VKDLQDSTGSSTATSESGHSQFGQSKSSTTDESPSTQGKSLSQSFGMSPPSSTQRPSLRKILAMDQSNSTPAKGKKVEARPPVVKQTIKVLDDLRGKVEEEVVLTETIMLGLLNDDSFMSEVDPTSLSTGLCAALSCKLELLMRRWSRLPAYGKRWV